MTHGLTRGKRVFVAPAQEGIYQVRLLRDDTTVLATSTVTVARRMTRKSVSPASVMDMHAEVAQEMGAWPQGSEVTRPLGRTMSTVPPIKQRPVVR
jgi:hypothetical protein